MWSRPLSRREAALKGGNTIFSFLATDRSLLTSATEQTCRSVTDSMVIWRFEEGATIRIDRDFGENVLLYDVAGYPIDFLNRANLPIKWKLFYEQGIGINEVELVTLTYDKLHKFTFPEKGALSHKLAAGKG
jgi:hypothetical protein